jgi:hypothetical protein
VAAEALKAEIAAAGANPERVEIPAHAFGVHTARGDTDLLDLDLMGFQRIFFKHACRNIVALLYCGHGRDGIPGIIAENLVS